MNLAASGKTSIFGVVEELGSRNRKHVISILVMRSAARIEATSSITQAGGRRWVITRRGIETREWVVPVSMWKRSSGRVSALGSSRFVFFAVDRVGRYQTQEVYLRRMKILKRDVRKLTM